MQIVWPLPDVLTVSISAPALAYKKVELSPLKILFVRLFQHIDSTDHN
jgi:hypothetical protein